MLGRSKKNSTPCLTPVVERLRHDWPTALLNVGFAREDFVSSLRVARYTFRALRYLCADQKRDEYGWKWEHLILLPAANRTMLDVLFNVIFILEDAEARLAWYHKSGWREQKMEYDRLNAEYGTEPEWVEWLSGFSRMIGMGKGLFKITTAEESTQRRKSSLGRTLERCQITVLIQIPATKPTISPLFERLVL